MSLTRRNRTRITRISSTHLVSFTHCATDSIEIHVSVAGAVYRSQALVAGVNVNSL